MNGQKTKQYICSFLSIFCCFWNISGRVLLSYPRFSPLFQTLALETSTSRGSPSPLGVEAHPTQLQKFSKAKNMKDLTLIYGWACSSSETAFHTLWGSVGLQNRCFSWSHSCAVLFSIGRALGWFCTSLSAVLCLLMDPIYQPWGRECWRGGSASRTSCLKVLFFFSDP